jgi:DNA-binding CsgD family transcriptional regulator
MSGHCLQQVDDAQLDGLECGAGPPTMRMPETQGVARTGGIAVTAGLAYAGVRTSPTELPSGVDPRVLIGTLSAAERDVLVLLARGRAPKQAAYERGTTIATVRSQIAAAKRKTGARTLGQLVALFAERSTLADLRLSGGVPAPPQSASACASNTLIARGADMVHLAEELFLCLFILALACVLVGCGERRDASRACRLTPRQLQAALLAGAGLKHSEIAITLGISSRQVQRLLGQARKRTGAASTAHLVAMLASDDLVASPSSESLATADLQQ